MVFYVCEFFRIKVDIQSKLYDQEGCVDYLDQDNNPISKNELVKKLLDEEKSWSGMWLEF